jgi:2-isopropylmalate synthase
MTRMIRIFDTTLRDGEQSPGASMNVEEKVIIAKQLARLGVDIIEAGFAYSSPGDFEAISRIAQEVEGPIVCSLARARPEDIDRAWESLKAAQKRRIHTFLSTSDIHLKYQFRLTREEALKRAVEMVQRARGHVEDVEFSPMDASRSDPVYLYEVLEAVIDAGATTVNIPDTVGYATTPEFGRLIRGIRENVPNIRSWKERAKSNARSMESVSGPATLHWKKSSWVYGPVGMSIVQIPRCAPKRFQRPVGW